MDKPNDLAALVAALGGPDTVLAHYDLSGPGALAYLGTLEPAGDDPDYHAAIAGSTDDA
jgi:hypothetical protein